MTAPFLVAFRSLMAPWVLIVSISGNVWTLEGCQLLIQMWIADITSIPCLQGGERPDSRLIITVGDECWCDDEKHLCQTQPLPLKHCVFLSCSAQALA